MKCKLAFIIRRLVLLFNVNQDSRRTTEKMKIAKVILNTRRVIGIKTLVLGSVSSHFFERVYTNQNNAIDNIM